MTEKERQDLADAMAADTRRSKRPIDIDERRRRNELLKDFRFLLDHGSKEDFANAIRALGLKDGSPEFAKALATWDETRGHR